MDDRTGWIMTISLIVVLSLLALLKKPLTGYLSRKNGVQTAAQRWAVTPTSYFQHYPGHGQGYSGYTDHAAMGYEVNDSLLQQSPETQFALAGFALGFLEGIADRDGIGGKRVQILSPTMLDQHALGWLGLMQSKGIDNAPPSTQNLHTIINLIGRELRESGPVCIPYWEKWQSRNYGNPRQESLRRSRTTATKQQALVIHYEERREDGHRLGQSAVMTD